MDAELLDTPQDDRQEVPFEGAKLTYKVIGERIPGKAVTIVIPGHGGGIASHDDLAKAIHNKSGQQSIVTNLAVLEHPLDISERVIDTEARGLIMLLQKESLTATPVNFVAHSLGAMIVARAAEYAKRLGMSSFDYDQGSRTVFISPAGSIKIDNPVNLLKRVILDSYPNNKVKREELTADREAATGDPGSSSLPKDLRLLLELGSKHLDYAHLRDSHLKPAIITYPDDQLFPWELMAQDSEHVDTMLEAADGIMAPIGMINRPKESAFHPSQSDHYTVNFNVGPTADSIIQYFEKSQAT